MRLVTGAEVEDPSTATFVAATAPEHLAAREPADQDETVRRRHVEVFAVHLLRVEGEALAEALGDRVGRVYDPQTLTVT